MPPHSILIRQLRRCELPEGAAAGMPAGWETFLEFVDNAYREADEERTLQDNMLASLSAEMDELNESLRVKEAHLSREHEKLTAIMHSLGDGLCVADSTGRIAFLNPEGARLLRCEQEPVGCSVADLSPELAAAVSGTAAVRADDGLFRRPDGSTFPVAYVLNPILREHVTQGSVLIFRDVTEKRQLESELRQAQKLESVGRLAAGVAHEINTPVQFVNDSVHFVRDAFGDLARVLASCEELLRQAPEGERSGPIAELAAAAEEADLAYLLEHVPKALERSLEGLGRVATIVRSMKEFAHPDQKEMAPADLNHAVWNTLVIARNEYKYVAELETELGELPAVTCLVGEINQVVLNIVVNAAHAIGDVVKGSEKKGRITVTTAVEGEDVLISIADTGGGIPTAIRERIYDPFFTTKEVGKGTGQGLAIARNVVVEKHGGALHFETEPGRGTTFFIRLPIVGKSAGVAA